MLKVQFVVKCCVGINISCLVVMIVISADIRHLVSIVRRLPSKLIDQDVALTDSDPCF